MLLDKLVQAKKEQKQLAKDTPPPQPIKRKANNDQTGIIDLFNDAHDLEAILLKKGYKKNGENYLHPNSQSGVAGLKVFVGDDGVKRCYSHNETDPLRGEHSHDAFSVVCTLNFDGDVGECVKYYAPILDPEGQAQRQREYAQQQDQKNILQMLDQIERKQGFRLIPATEILETQLQVNWLIKKHLPAQSLVMLHGDPAAGKSVIVLGWALSIATGNEWLGFKTQQGKVAILAGEGFYGYRNRIKAWSKANNTPSNGNLLVSNAGLGLDTKEGLQTALDALNAIDGGVDLVVIDTLHRNVTGDENSAKDMALFIQACDAIKEQLQCSVMIIHHSGVSNKDRARGSSSLLAAVDVAFHLSVDPQGVRLLTQTKNKDSEPIKPLAFDLVQVELGEVDEDGELKTSVVLEHKPDHDTSKKQKPPTDAQQNGFRELLKLLPNDHSSVTLDEWRESAKANYTGDPSSSTFRSAFKRVVDYWINRGVISNNGGVIRLADLVDPWVKREVAQYGLNVVDAFDELGDF